MKVIIFLLITSLFKGIVIAQLPPAAQVIYDSCVANTPGNVDYASTNGAEIISTHDGSSFYLQWFPNGITPSNSPIIVTLHGSKGNAFNEFKSWHLSAQEHNCGIIALQYNKYTNIFDYQNGYFQDDTIYNYIDTIMKRISYPSNKALLHGFSLGSARSYAVIYNDMISGNNYFCTTISNAGKIDLSYNLYESIDLIENVFQGKHWNLFCGPPEVYSSGPCDGLDFTQDWLTAKGAIVDIYVQDPNLGHNGFQLPESENYKDTMLNKYLECFGQTSFVNENSDVAKTITIYPNPFSSDFTIQTNHTFNNASILIFSVLGEPRSELKNISTSKIVVQRDNLMPGVYFVHIKEANALNIFKLVLKE